MEQICFSQETVNMVNNTIYFFIKVILLFLSYRLFFFHMNIVGTIFYWTFKSIFFCLEILSYPLWVLWYLFEELLQYLYR